MSKTTKRAPADKAVELNHDDFTFDHDGDTFTLPSYASFKAGTIRKVRRMDDTDAMFTLVEDVADEDTLEAIDSMDMTELADLMRRWIVAAGVTLPE